MTYYPLVLSTICAFALSCSTSRGPATQSAPGKSALGSAEKEHHGATSPGHERTEARAAQGPKPLPPPPVTPPKHTADTQKTAHKTYTIDRTRTSGQKIIEQAGTISLIEKTPLSGDSHDYAKQIYDRTGIGPTLRYVAFKSTTKLPWAPLSALKKGDWISFIHPTSKKRVSAIFVRVVNKKRGTARCIAQLIKGKRGRTYTLSLGKVYRVIRSPRLVPLPIPAKYAKTKGLWVLEVARRIAFKQKRIIVGSCWDFADRVYKEAGFPRSKRRRIFASRKKGPYADTRLLKPGDWVYHVNMEYFGVEHSAIFVNWVDKKRKIARMIAYAGQNRREPGRYKQHTLAKVFTIYRPK